MSIESDSGQPSRILLVDDEPEVLDMIVACLESVKYVVTVAPSGVEGLQRLQDDDYALVIVERGIAGMSGDAFAEAVKMRAPGTPIILVSGRTGPPVSSGMFAGILRKPFTFTELTVAVEDALGGD